MQSVCLGRAGEAQRVISGGVTAAAAGDLQPAIRDGLEGGIHAELAAGDFPAPGIIGGGRGKRQRGRDRDGEYQFHGALFCPLSHQVFHRPALQANGGFLRNLYRLVTLSVRFPMLAVKDTSEVVMSLLLIILLVLLLAGGGFGYSRYGAVGGSGIVGTVLI